METRQFTVNQDAEGTFRFKGKLTIHDLEYLKEFLDSSLDRIKNIFLNMEKVVYADTASIQLLIAFRKARSSEVNWKITDMSSELEKILELSDLKKELI
ncbi:MAG: STAS domain-containing protein [Proteobacteria bacterium]|nr:STAS domain-containing protein [Desulfobacteraceae bacterium]MBU3981164.1 STAS domain-containing protein [Pseudomonadota bacterium]MBU4013630.1 STAS domain-containing protein [Pseudomonadota bacterium]MBU4069083.1 STAS domain-containing protein [Pseudomonadota bacterium]MBU4100490.1 STAS domain-containing protein [Pseudomonadota bacterium]